MDHNTDAKDEVVYTAIASAITTYHELNPSTIDELDNEPSPLEFMRYVARNRPFVVRRAVLHWAAGKKWNAHYLCEVMGNEGVNVAITPHGNADAIVEQPDGQLCFVEPYETLEPFPSFLDYVRTQSGCSNPGMDKQCVRYAQTQNDNLRGEYASLFQDVPAEIAFARIALEQTADAINLWIGNEQSVTSLHKDNYENIYAQIRGKKHFVLLPPIEMPCTNERALRKARYVSIANEQPVLSSDFAIEVDADGAKVPVSIWDPDEPDEGSSTYSHLSSPTRVTLDEGDMLYLPALWYHKVSQSSGAEGFACSVNYWYDLNFSGGFWTASSFLRDIVTAAQ